MYTSLYIYKCIYMCIYVYTYVYGYIYLCTYLYIVCTYIYIHIHMLIYLYTYKYIYMWTYEVFCIYDIMQSLTIEDNKRSLYWLCYMTYQCRGKRLLKVSTLKASIHKPFCTPCLFKSPQSYFNRIYSKSVS